MLSLEEALASLERLPQPASVENIASILHKCRKQKNLGYALRLYAYMRKSGLEAHKFLGNHLVPMLVEVGSMCHAQQAFDSLVDRNEFAWTSLITGYTKCGQSQQALILYKKMQEDRVHPTAFTFVALLKACAGLKDTERGQEIHDEIARKGLEADPFVGNALVDMYAKCGSFAKAQEVFDKIPVRDVVSWTALIAGFVEQGLGREALNCYKQMQMQGVSPDAITFVCSLKACGSIGAIEEGRTIHSEIAKKGLLENDLVVGSSLVDMYAKCGAPAKAREAFDKLPAQNVVSWTALISGYAEHGLGYEALDCFEQMQLEGASPNDITFICSLKACGSVGAIDKGREIHSVIARRNLERDIVVGSSLVDMYAKCGSPAEAQETFDKLSVRSVVSWTALIAGYVEHGLGQEALDGFEQMQLEGITPNASTFACGLKACGSIGATGKGREIHEQIGRNGLLEREPFVGNTLVDMYCKFGLLVEAQEVFDNLPVRNEVSWNALIAGYARLGESDNVFDMLNRMRREGTKPNGVTFLSVLTVCSHTGLVDKGQMCFETMNEVYGITPTIDHHTCMVDLLGRAGQLDKAIAMIMKMPFDLNPVAWHTLLSACQKWSNVDLARQTFKDAVQWGEKDATVYVLTSNIYADANMQQDEKVVQETSKRTSTDIARTELVTVTG